MSTFVGMSEFAHDCWHEPDEESHLCWCSLDRNHPEPEYLP